MIHSASPPGLAAGDDNTPQHGSTADPVSATRFFELGWWRLAFFGAVLLGELLIIAFCYQFLVDIECADFERPGACRAVRESLGRLLSVALLLGLVMTTRWQLFGFLAAGGARAGGLTIRAASGAMLTGLVLMLLPALWYGSTAGLAVLAVFLTAGASISVLGALLGTAPFTCWLSMLRRGGLWLWLAIGTALLSPEMTGLLNGAWGWAPLTAATFALVLSVLALFPGKLTSNPAEMVIGFDEFLVRVGEPCSGLQGFALITLVMASFIALERQRLRLPLAAILLPIGLLASFALNIVRIAVLIWIGARISPELAVNAFHSYAGWLLFTLLSIGLVGGAHLTPALWRNDVSDARSTPRVSAGALQHDPVTAMLVPLLVLLLSGLFASTFFMTPEAAYPLRVPMMAAGLVLFLPFWMRLDWRTDLLPPLAGIAVGLLWIVTASSHGAVVPHPPYAGLGLAATSIWIAMRLVGTALLVPLIEEAAFRGYLLGHLLKPQGKAGRIGAALVSAAAFAFLHQSGAAAFIAGLVFAGIYMRRVKLADAVWAHAAANLVVFAAAAITGNWSLI